VKERCPQRRKWVMRNHGTPASYESRKGIENIEGPKDETGKMADRTAIASTFHITSTRIDIFKLILTSHPYSTLFPLPASHHSLFFISIFAGKYLIRKTLGISISSQRYICPKFLFFATRFYRAPFVDSTIDENLHFIAKRNRLACTYAEIFLYTPASQILQT